jgi:hypothetical protein
MPFSSSYAFHGAAQPRKPGTARSSNISGVACNGRQRIGYMNGALESGERCAQEIMSS